MRKGSAVQRIFAEVSALVVARVMLAASILLLLAEQPMSKAELTS